MEFGGHYILAAPRTAVWRALNDTSVLGASIPGCQRIDWIGPDTLEARIAVNLGVARPVFTGDLELTDVIPAQSYTLTGRGHGGLLGMAHASADITLADHAEGTELRFRAAGKASGRLMKLGRAVLGGRAQSVIDGFFERFAAAMGTEIRTIAPEAETSS